MLFERVAKRAAFVPVPLLFFPGRSTVLAVKQVADGATPGLIYFPMSLNFVCGQVLLGVGIRRFLSGTLRAAIGKAGLVGPQLEFLGAYGASFDRKRHSYKS
jgi:hypothetical protein